MDQANKACARFPAPARAFAVSGSTASGSSSCRPNGSTSRGIARSTNGPFHSVVSDAAQR